MPTSTRENPFTKSHPRDAWEYARQVVEGEIPACRFVKLACERFLKDLERDDLVFDEVAAQRVCNFYETLPHVKDHWASTGQLFAMEPWQKFTECNLFGWYWSNGKRRFRESYEEVPRKNGKSFKMAARGAYTFCADEVFGAEVYSGATTEKQAWEVFRPIKQIFERTPQLTKYYNVEVNAKNLNIMTTGSRCEPIIGDPGDGSSPSHAICDEYHEHQSDRLVQTMITGMGARSMFGSPLMSYITTAGDNMGGPCFEKRQEIIKILEGSVEDDTIFGIIYTIDKGDDWQDESSMIKANPNYGVSVDPGFLKQELAKARRSATKQNEFKTKHLNVWVGARAAWMNMLAWQKQKKDISLESFKGHKCYVAVDLSSKLDLTSVCILFKRDGEYYPFFKFYAPEDAVSDNDKYREFVTKGEIVETPGTTVDYSYIEEDLKELAKQFTVEYFIFDQWQAGYLITRMQELRLPVMELPMNVKNLSDAMKEVEAQVLDGKLWHDGNSCMTWQIGNVASKVDARNNIYPRKANENDKRCHIDGPVTLIMAMTRWTLDKERGGLDDFLANPVSV